MLVGIGIFSVKCSTTDVFWLQKLSQFHQPFAQHNHSPCHVLPLVGTDLTLPTLYQIRFLPFARVLSGAFFDETPGVICQRKGHVIKRLGLF